MKLVLGSILRMIGWQKLLGMVWDIIDDDLKKHAQSTDNKFDDEAIKVIDDLIKQLTQK